MIHSIVLCPARLSSCLKHRLGRMLMMLQEKLARKQRAVLLFTSCCVRVQIRHRGREPPYPLCRGPGTHRVALTRANHPAPTPWLTIHQPPEEVQRVLKETARRSRKPWRCLLPASRNRLLRQQAIAESCCFSCSTAAGANRSKIYCRCVSNRLPVINSTRFSITRRLRTRRG